MSERHSFNPIEEHAFLKLGPTEERNKKEAEFRRERLEQREAIAVIGGLVMEEVFREPSPSAEQLREIVDTWTGEARLAEYQKRIAKDLINEYAKRRKKIAKERAAVTDDWELLHRLTSFEKGKAGHVEAVIRPFTVHFRLDSDTYRKLENRQEPDMRSGGFFSARWSSVTFEDLKYRSSDSTMLHEEMHATYYLIEKVLSRHLKKDLFSPSRPNLEDVERRLRHGGNPAKAIREYMRDSILRRADRVKDELFAYTREQARSQHSVNKILLQSKQERGLYDYFEQDRKELAAFATKCANEDRLVVEPIIKEEFGQMHSQLVEEGATALHYLLREEGYTFMQAVFFLADIPLERWSAEIQPLRDRKLATKK